MHIATDIETPTAFLFFVHYPSDSSCTDQSERPWIFTTYDGVVMTSNNKMETDSEMTECFITSSNVIVYYTIILTNVITIKIARIIYGVCWQRNSTSPACSVIKTLDFIALSWHCVTGQDTKGIWVTVVSAGANTFHKGRETAKIMEYFRNLCPLIKFPSSMLTQDCLHPFNAICSDMNKAEVAICSVDAIVNLIAAVMRSHINRRCWWWDLGTIVWMPLKSWVESHRFE